MYYVVGANIQFSTGGIAKLSLGLPKRVLAPEVPIFSDPMGSRWDLGHPWYAVRTHTIQKIFFFFYITALKKAYIQCCI